MPTTLGTNCGECKTFLPVRIRIIRCDTCKQFFHVKCCGINHKTYNYIKESNGTWHCNKNCMKAVPHSNTRILIQDDVTVRYCYF